jgi:hypothetical protein
MRKAGPRDKENKKISYYAVQGPEKNKMGGAREEEGSDSGCPLKRERVASV